MSQIGEVVHPNDLVQDELDPSQVVDHEGSALSRFMSGGLSTSPLNPMNWVRAASHPIDTISSIVGDPISELMQAGKHAGEVITGSQGDRLTPAVQTIEHLAGAIPFVGKALTHAGEQIGDGDIAGGTGELAGIASGALLPKITGRVPGAVTRVGQGMEAVGEAFKGHSKWSGAAAMSHGNIAAGAGIMAAPYALEYGGKGLQAAGSALEGLKNRVSGAPVVDRYMPNEGAGPQTYAAPASVEPNQYVVDPHMPNTSGYDAPVDGLQQAARPEPSVADLARHAEAEAHNQLRNTPFGNGQVAPEGIVPHEIWTDTSAAEGTGLPKGVKLDHDLGMKVPDVQVPSDLTTEGGASYDPSYAGTPGLSVGDDSMLQALKQEAAAPIDEPTPTLRRDAHWGPDNQGSKVPLLADAKIPTPELIDQWRAAHEAGDTVAEESLRKAIDQRINMDQWHGGYKSSKSSVTGKSTKQVRTAVDKLREATR